MSSLSGRELARRLAGVPMQGLRRLWHCAGSRQCVHGCAALGLACLVIITYELGSVNQELGTIAQAQAIGAYAVLRQLQAPGQAALARSGVERAATGSVRGAIAAIDPTLLGAVEGVHATSAATSATASPRPAHGP